jgi:hypothetical protein
MQFRNGFDKAIAARLALSCGETELIRGNRFLDSTGSVVREPNTQLPYNERIIAVRRIGG